MIERKELSESQHLHWDRIMDDRAIQAGREARLLAAMLKELGGNVNEGWSFDEQSRVFYRVTDGSTTDPAGTGQSSTGVGPA